MTTTTRPVRRPTDRKPKASVIAAQLQAAQIAAEKKERERADRENYKASMVEDLTNTSSVDEDALRREQLIANGVGSRKTAVKILLLTVLFVGLTVGSIIMFFNHLLVPAAITLLAAGSALLGLSLWVKSLYAELVNEFGREETIDLLLSMTKGKNEVEKDAA